MCQAKDAAYGVNENTNTTLCVGGKIILVQHTFIKSYLNIKNSSEVWQPKCEAITSKVETHSGRAQMAP